ncbi:MAG TPA: hypothetical protein P5336_11550 [Treponema sp.]|nr:hypothetical protein [Treponema sp.]
MLHHSKASRLIPIFAEGVSQEKPEEAANAQLFKERTTAKVV